MKELLISLFVTIAVFTGGYFSKEYLKKSGSEVVKKLDQIEAQLEEDKFDQKNEVYEITSDWNKLKDIWHLIIDHTLVDEIELEIVKFVKYYENQQKEEALVEIATIKTLIEDIPKAQTFSLVNVF